RGRGRSQRPAACSGRGFARRGRRRRLGGPQRLASRRELRQRPRCRRSALADAGLKARGGRVSDAPLAAQLEASRAYLGALAYRLSGCAADADEITQETLARALERPPSGKLRLWLTRVAVNLGRDELRRRRRGYVGEWLPSPVPTDEPPSFEPIELH